MRSLIATLISAEELLAAGAALKEIDAYLAENTARRSAFCKALTKELCERVGMLMHILTFDGEPYAIYDHRYSVPLFLMSNGLTGRGVAETRQNIGKLIQYIDAEVTAPSGRFLTEKQEVETLEAVTARYPYFKIVGKERPLTILNLDNSNRQYNSVCSVGGLGEQSIVMMYHLKPGPDGNGSPIAVFLHELGHALHIAITGSVEVPEEFYKFQNVFSQKLSPGDPMAGDVFADCFAIAVMHGGPLQRHMPFEVDNIIGEMIRRFFTGLFQKYTQ